MVQRNQAESEAVEQSFEVFQFLFRALAFAGAAADFVEQFAGAAVDVFALKEVLV